MHELARCVLAVGDHVLDGFVAECEDGTLTFHSERGAVEQLQIEDDVQALVLDPVRGEFRYSGWVAEVEAPIVRVVDLELTSVLQKREVARVDITQICTGVVTSPDADARSISFVVLDVSAHGMRVSTTTTLSEADRIAFQLQAGDTSVALDAEVLRSQRTPSGSVHYGCRFVDLAEGDADRLFRYVLQTQGAQRRTRLRS